MLYKGERISGRISREMDRKVTRSIQMIFRTPWPPNERAKVSYIVSEGLYAGGHRLTEAEKQEKVAKALSDVGLLPEFASRFPHEFSGGQRQRIGIARPSSWTRNSSSLTSPSPPWTCPSGPRCST